MKVNEQGLRTVLSVDTVGPVFPIAVVGLNEATNFTQGKIRKSHFGTTYSFHLSQI